MGRVVSERSITIKELMAEDRYASVEGDVVDEKIRAAPVANIAAPAAYGAPIIHMAAPGASGAPVTFAAPVAYGAPPSPTQRPQHPALLSPQLLHAAPVTGAQVIQA